MSAVSVHVFVDAFQVPTVEQSPPVSDLRLIPDVLTVPLGGPDCAAGGSGTVNVELDSGEVLPNCFTTQMRLYAPDTQSFGISICLLETLLYNVCSHIDAKGSTAVPSFFTVNFVYAVELRLSVITFRVLSVDDVELRYADALMVGGVVSGAPSKITVTVKLAVPTFPAASLAVHVTVVVPIGNKKPEDGEQVGPEVTLTLSDT